MQDFVSTLAQSALSLAVTLPSLVYAGGTVFVRRYVSHDKPVQPFWFGQRLVIVLIHGLGGDYSSLKTLLDNLRSKCGEQVLILVPELGVSGVASVEEDGRAVVRAIDSAGVPRGGNVDIRAVGVSRGGLIACWLVTTSDEKGGSRAGQISRVVTVSSPLRGTKVARYHPLSAITRKQLDHGSDFTQSLELAVEQAAARFSIISIVPYIDHMIVPTSAASYPSSIILRPIGWNAWRNHIAIQNDPILTSAVLSEITDLHSSQTPQ